MEPEWFSMLGCRNAVCLVVAGLLAGCNLAEHRQIDDTLAEQTRRLRSLDGMAKSAPLSPPESPTLVGQRPEPRALAPDAELTPPPPPIPVAPMKTEPGTRPKFQLKVPDGLPGANAKPLSLPEDPLEREKYLDKVFPPLPPLKPTPVLAAGPEGHPMSLEDLQRIAMIYSPAIKKAEAAVESARGTVRDAGAYPNPTFSFEHDTIQTGPAGYPGFFIDQLIKTGNKLKLKQAAAAMDLLNAEAALRRARSDLFYQVRTHYFAILVARENARVNEGFATFTEEIYRVQLSLLKRTFAAVYEPLQLRPLALQAQLNLIQARNQELASWRQLTADLGVPEMPPSELAGRVDMRVPSFDYETVRQRVLNYHTDVITAENGVRQSQFNLAYEKIVPVPDVDVRVLVQKDYTTTPFQISSSVSAGMTIPVWYRNQGNIKRARGGLAQAVANVPLTRNNLTGTLADAYNRYETARLQVAISLQQVEDQVRVYRGIYNRRQSDPTNVGFGDLVTAQQTLGTYIANYVTALGLQWVAVVDVANVLQSDDLYQTEKMSDVAPVPRLPLGLPLLPAPSTGKKGGDDE